MRKDRAMLAPALDPGGDSNGGYSCHSWPRLLPTKAPRAGSSPAGPRDGHVPGFCAALRAAARCSGLRCQLGERRLTAPGLPARRPLTDCVFIYFLFSDDIARQMYFSIAFVDLAERVNKVIAIDYDTAENCSSKVGAL